MLERVEQNYRHAVLGIQKERAAGAYKQEESRWAQRGTKGAEAGVRGVNEALLRCWCLVHTGNKSVVQSSTAGLGGRDY